MIHVERKPCSIEIEGEQWSYVPPTVLALLSIHDVLAKTESATIKDAVGALCEIAEHLEMVRHDGKKACELLGDYTLQQLQSIVYSALSHSHLSESDKKK